MVTIDADTLRERIRERLDESEWQLCGNCDCGLSADDLKFQHCSNCGVGLDVGDESAKGE